MVRIQEHIIERIRETADIHDVVSGYVNLKKRGRNFFGVCPFHDEKTPSFSINIDKQIFKCFGCGKGGGTINFIMELERLDFVDAVKFLGNKYNINVEINHNSKSSNDLYNQLYKMNEIANSYFINNLNENIKKILKERNVTEASIKKFNIGFSINKFDNLLTLIRKENFNSESLKKGGLFLDNEKGYCDRFRNRLMFPIHNQFNKIIGFSGRVIDKEQKTAKYMNSPETPIYNKSKTLYGMHLTKNNIIDEKSVIVVEGYLDLIQIYQAGFKNVLAVCGTAFTEQHAISISKLCKTIYLAYDGDKAGKEAAIRAGYVILKSNMDPRIIEIPNGIDPDDMIQVDGAEAFNNALNKSISLLEFQYKIESQSFQSEQDKIEFLNKVISEIINIENPLKLESCVKELSNITQFNIDSILKTMKMLKSKKNKFKIDKRFNENMNVQNNSEIISSIEKELVNFCFTNDSRLRELIKENLNLEWIESNQIKEIYNNIYIHLSSEDMIKPEIIMNELKNQNLRDLMADLIFKEMDPNKNIIADCLIRIEKNYLKKKISSIRENLKKENISPQEKEKYLKQVIEMQNQSQKIISKYNEE